MGIAQDIVDGIYDNHHTFARERWEGGRLLGKIDAKLIEHEEKRGMPFEAWGHYPEPPRANDWCVYLVECRDGSYYCGITNNLQNRLQAHNEGKGAKYTAGRRPVRLVASRHGLTRSSAAKLEAEVKKRPKKEKFLL